MGVREFFQRLLDQSRSDEKLAGALPFSHAEFDLKLAWNLTMTGGETVLTGVVQNLRWAHLEAGEVWVAALDSAGSKLAREVCYLPHQIRQGDSARFTIRLPLALPPGTALQFTYRYRGSDGGDGGTTWSQSFEFPVPAPEEIPQPSQTRR